MTRYRFPFPGISTGFGGYPGHTGTDFPAAEGTPIPAVTDFVVTSKGFDKTGGGNYLRGTATDGVRLYFGHLMSPATLEVGAKVNLGEPVGLVGHTGKVISLTGGNGDHLHLQFENSRGVPFDPVPYIQARLITTADLTITPLQRKAITMDLYQYGGIDCRVWDGNVMPSPDSDITDAWVGRYGPSKFRGKEEKTWAIWADRDGAGYDIPQGVIATVVRSQKAGTALAWSRGRGYYTPGK